MTRTPGETTTSTSRQPTREGGLRLADVLAAGLASAVAAIVGGLLGAVGSVISAFVVSAVSSIVLPLLRRPLRVGEDRLRRAPAGADEPAPRRDHREPAATRAGKAAAPRSKAHRRRRILVAIGTAVGALVVAFGSIFAVQALTGQQLSTGTGTLQQRVTGGGPGSGTDGNTVTPSPTAPASGGGAGQGTSTPNATPTPSSGTGETSGGSGSGDSTIAPSATPSSSAGTTGDGSRSSGNDATNNDPGTGGSTGSSSNED